MVATTFLDTNEQNIETSNDLINSLIKEVREKTKRNWQVIETTREKTPLILKILNREKFLWYKVETFHFYELLIEVGGMAPFQCINFYNESNRRNSLNFRVSADYIVSYLYGILAGIHGD